ncbi:MAG: cytochrome c oxidase subunit II [Pacificimonas sp.]
MRQFTALAAGLALLFAAGSTMAQDLEPITAGQDTDSRTVSGNLTPEEQVALTPDEPETVPSAVDGGLANAGTLSDATLGQPLGGEAIQPQVTELGQRLNDFNSALLIVMTVITLFVFALLTWAMIRYRRKANPVPSKTTHNVLIEVIWTLAPVVILALIAVPSFALLNDQYDPPEADVTIKATGHQWYWSYEYPDEGGFGFDSIMLTAEEAAANGEPRLLATDNRVVVPVNSTVKVLVTSADVLHSWAMPAFWVKMDAVPGKINETWFNAERTGVFYGQCSELCGTQHGFMPIAVEVVERDQYAAWVARRQDDAGIDPADLVETAGAEDIATDDVDLTTLEGVMPDGDLQEADAPIAADGDIANTAPVDGTVSQQSNRVSNEGPVDRN